MVTDDVGRVVVIDDSGDATVYASASDAEASLESIDVENGLLRAYNAHGGVIDLVPIRGRVRLRLTRLPPKRHDERVLRDALIATLARLGAMEAAAAGLSSTPELIELLLAQQKRQAFGVANAWRAIRRRLRLISRR